MDVGQVRIFPYRACASMAMARSKRNVADVKRARNIASRCGADHRARANGERFIFNRRTAAAPARERHAAGLPAHHAHALLRAALPFPVRTPCSAMPLIRR